MTRNSVQLDHALSEARAWIKRANSLDRDKLYWIQWESRNLGYHEEVEDRIIRRHENVKKRC